MTQRRPTRGDGDSTAPLDALALYRAEVARYGRLDATTAAALARKAQDGDRLARTDLVNAHLWLVVEVACGFAHGGRRGDLMELISLGNLRLLTCVDGWGGGGSFQAFVSACLRNAYRDTRRHHAANGRDKLLPLFDETEGSGGGSAVYEDTRESVEAQVERELADEQTLALVRVVLTAREQYVVLRLAGLLAGPAALPVRATVDFALLAAELHTTQGAAKQVRYRAANKLRPYLQALGGPGSGPVLSSLTLALETKKAARKTTTTATHKPRQERASAVANTDQTSSAASRGGLGGLGHFSVPEGSTGTKARSNTNTKRATKRAS